jgi:hypothetical protein
MDEAEFAVFVVVEVDGRDEWGGYAPHWHVLFGIDGAPAVSRPYDRFREAAAVAGEATALLHRWLAEAAERDALDAQAGQEGEG